MGAPAGNQNAKNRGLWQSAIKRALAKKNPEGLQAASEDAAAILVDAVFLGERWALEELGNRLDGMPAQVVVMTGDEEGGPVQIVGRIVLVKPEQ